MELLQEAARAAAETKTRILEDARESAVRAKERRKLDQRRELARRRQNLHSREVRMHKAIQGAQALLGLVTTNEFTELLELRKQLVLYAREETFEDSGLYLTNSGIILEAKVYGIAYGSNDSIMGRAGCDPEDSLRIMLDTRVTDELLLARKLEGLYNPHGPSPLRELDADDEERGHLEVALREAMAEEILFQILVDCSDSERLSRYVMRAIN